MAEPSKAIRVEIYDRVYQLRSEAGESYTRQLAQSVDTAMRSIAEKTQTYDSLRLAVLAALLQVLHSSSVQRAQWHARFSIVTSHLKVPH